MLSRTFFRRLFPSLWLVGLATALLGTTLLSAQQPDPVMADFQPDEQYALAIGGSFADADVYLSKRARAVLIVAEELDRPLLVWAGSGRVDAVDSTDLLKRPEGGYDVAAGADRSYLGDFRQQELDLVLPVSGRDVRLRPSPALVGEHTLDELLRHSPKYQEGIDAYRPSAERLASLKAVTEETEVRIFFGSWCHVCKTYLPNALRVQQEITGSKLSFSYYGLDYPPKGWQDPEVQRQGVDGLPTAIVLRGGRELGRFSGAGGFEEPEKSLLGVLSKAK